MELYLNSIKNSFHWYKNISSSILFTQQHERIQILNEYVEASDKVEFKWFWSQ